MKQMRRPLTEVAGYGEKPISKTAAMTAVGPVVYAVRVGALIKFGFTTDLGNRASSLGADEVLAFAPGTPEVEQCIHISLKPSLAKGREWYHPTDEVLDVVNKMREVLGRQPVG